MRDRDDLLSEDQMEGEVRQTLGALRRAASAAGFLTSDPGVQIALLNVYAQLSTGVTLQKGIGVLERLADQLRALRRGGLS